MFSIWLLRWSSAGHLGSIVNSLVKDLITPLIAAIVQKPDFSYLVLKIHGANITYGNFLNALISFLLIAVSVYFFVVLPVNTLMAKMKLTATPPPPPPTKPCPECLSDIPAAARRCSHCGQPVPSQRSRSFVPPECVGI